MDKVSAVIVGIVGRRAIAVYWRGVRHAIAHRIARTRCFHRSRAEEQSNDTRIAILRQSGSPGIAQKRLNDAVLVVSRRVVHRPHHLVSHWNLPKDDAIAGNADECRDPEREIVEILGPVPPAAIVLSHLVKSGVSVGELAEGQVEAGAERLVEAGRAGGTRPDFRRIGVNSATMLMPVPQMLIW